MRELLGDGSLGGLYERPDDDVLRVWQAGVEEVRDAARERLARVPDLDGPGRARHRHGARDRRRDRATRSRRTGPTVHGVRPATPSTSRDAEQVDGARRRGSAAVDILVNNAGGVVGQVGRPLEEVSDDDWRAVVDANLTSTFVCTRAVVPGMKAARLRPDRQHLLRRRAQRQPHRHPGLREREGRARSASRARPRTSSGRFGITVNSIAPGFVLSNPTSDRQWESYGEEGQRALLEKIATRRLGTPEDIANGVLFFVSEESSWVTGQVISIDGGHSIF